MSLFDVLRYPLDINFTVEDLNRIPCSILNEWWDGLIELHKLSTFGGVAGMMYNPDYLVARMSFYMNVCAKDERKAYALKVLQHRLKEYDEPV